MKKITPFCILAALLVTVGAVNGQNVYHPITDGCTWSVSNEKYMTTGDTLLDGKTYLKIYRQVGSQPFEFDLEDAEYFAAIRNDTAEKKVYAYLPAGTWIRDLSDFSVSQTDIAMEVLVYDFSLKIGDTLTYYIMGSSVAKAVAVRTESANIYVGQLGYSSVSHQYSTEDTVVTLSDNSLRHQILLHGISTPDNVWIEGIGGIRGFNEGEQITFSDYGRKTLLCFAENSSVAFHTEYDFDSDPNDCFCNGFGGDVPEIEKLDVRIFPNPVSDRLYISVQNSQEESFTIQILDMMGTCLYQKNIPDNNLDNHIDIKQLPKGLYILYVKQNNLNNSFKIVKL